MDNPQTWLGKSLDEKGYSDLRDQAQAFNNSYSVAFNDGEKKLDCHELISKFLQHCTPERYEQAIGWDIEKMSQEIDPILAQFEKRFSPATTAVVKTWGMTASCSTSTMRTSVVLIPEEGE